MDFQKILHPTQKSQSQNLSQNSIFVIAPYWSVGTWVFDDPAVGLVREPFVSGVPEIINELVKGIPNAREGFRLTFSASPFPGFQEYYKKSRVDAGGTWYAAASGDEGWLCP